MKYKILKLLMPKKYGVSPFVPYSVIADELKISIDSLHDYALDLEPEYLNIGVSDEIKSLQITSRGIDYVQDTKKQKFYNTITILTFLVSLISLFYQIFIS